MLVLTHDVVHAEGTGAVLQQPGVHAVFMELMSTGDDPQMLRKKNEGQEGKTRGEATKQRAHFFNLTNDRSVPRSVSSHLPVLELLQANGADGARVGAAGGPPGRPVTL